MNAKQAYRLIVTRAGWMPSALAGGDRVDHVEIVEVDSGEAVLFWDCQPRQATRIARAIRADLAQLAPEDFIARWSQLGQE